jgi:hypothetical protein
MLIERISSVKGRLAARVSIKTTRGGSDSFDAYEYDARNRLTAACFSVSASATSCSGAADAVGYA